jgi:transposase
MGTQARIDVCRKKSTQYPVSPTGGKYTMYIGIDLHKEYCYLTALNQKGDIVRSEKIKNTREELTSLAHWIPRGSSIVLEACSTWYSIYDQLTEKGMTVKLAHPLKTRAIAEARIKTDKVDSEILARLLRADFIPEAYVPPQQIREQRDILRYKKSLVTMRTRIKNKIHALLGKNGVTHPFTDLFGKKGRAFLATLTLLSSQRVALDSLLRQLDFYNGEIESLHGHIAHMAQDNDQVKTLMTIPGIDYYSAMIILHEIGDVHRFPSYKKLCSYAGLIPRVHQSGKTHWTGNITKEGNTFLRWILIQITYQIVRHPGDLQSFYQKLKKRKGGKIAIVATARKLLRVIHCMLTRDDTYRFEKTGLTTQKITKMKNEARSLLPRME